MSYTRDFVTRRGTVTLFVPSMENAGGSYATNVAAIVGVRVRLSAILVMSKTPTFRVYIYISVFFATEFAVLRVTPPSPASPPWLPWCVAKGHTHARAQRDRLPRRFADDTKIITILLYTRVRRRCHPVNLNNTHTDNNVVFFFPAFPEYPIYIIHSRPA